MKRMTNNDNMLRDDHTGKLHPLESTRLTSALQHQIGNLEIPCVPSALWPRPKTGR